MCGQAADDRLSAGGTPHPPARVMWHGITRRRAYPAPSADRSGHDAAIAKLHATDASTVQTAQNTERTMQERGQPDQADRGRGERRQESGGGAVAARRARRARAGGDRRDWGAVRRGDGGDDGGAGGAIASRQRIDQQVIALQYGAPASLGSRLLDPIDRQVNHEVDVVDCAKRAVDAAGQRTRHEVCRTHGIQRRRHDTERFDRLIGITHGDAAPPPR